MILLMTGSGTLELGEVETWLILMQGSATLEASPETDFTLEEIVFQGQSSITVDNAQTFIFGACTYTLQELDLLGAGSLDILDTEVFSPYNQLFLESLALFGQGALSVETLNTAIIPWLIARGQGSLVLDGGILYEQNKPCYCPPLTTLRLCMSQLSNYLELALLRSSVGLGDYVYPYMIRVSAVTVGATYSIIIGATTYSHVAVALDDEAAILDALALALVAAPVTTQRGYDQDNVPFLIVRQDVSYTPIDLQVAGSLARTREVFGALFLSTIDEASGGTEIAGFGYTRELIPFNAPTVVGANTQTSNSADVTFGPAVAGAWGTVTYFALMDAPTGGNMLYYAPLPTPRLIAAGDAITILAGRVFIRLD